MRNTLSNSNRGGGLVAMYAVKTSDQQPSRRRPISDRIKARMVQTLKNRGWLASIHDSDRTLVAYIRTARERRECGVCNGTGKGPGQSSYPEPCHACNGRGTMYNATEF